VPLRVRGLGFYKGKGSRGLRGCREPTHSQMYSNVLTEEARFIAEVLE
jgi:hypothetical protein